MNHPITITTIDNNKLKGVFTTFDTYNSDNNRIYPAHIFDHYVKELYIKEILLKEPQTKMLCLSMLELYPLCGKYFTYGVTENLKKLLTSSNPNEYNLGINLWKNLTH